MNICNTALIYSLPRGVLLKRRYEIIEVVGNGSFGIVYKCKDIALDRLVAVKELFPYELVKRASSDDYTVIPAQEDYKSLFLKRKDRFKVESDIMTRLCDIDNVVKIYDFFEENGTAYIVMELLEGNTLEKRVEMNGLLKAEAITELMFPMLNAVSEIHNRGIIHRDICPGNIMLMNDGTLKLYDFGASINADCDKTAWFVNPGFSPKEQYDNCKYGPWTDIYAVSSTMYFCVTGVVPCESVRCISEENILPVSEMGIDIPVHIDRAILKGMSVDVVNRFQSISDFIFALYCRDCN